MTVSNNVFGGKHYTVGDSCYNNIIIIKNINVKIHVHDCLVNSSTKWEISIPDEIKPYKITVKFLYVRKKTYTTQMFKKV